MKGSWIKLMKVQVQIRFLRWKITKQFTPSQKVHKRMMKNRKVVQTKLCNLSENRTEKKDHGDGITFTKLALTRMNPEIITKFPVVPLSSTSPGTTHKKLSTQEFLAGIYQSKETSTDLERYSLFPTLGNTEGFCLLETYLWQGYWFLASRSTPVFQVNQRGSGQQ